MNILIFEPTGLWRPHTGTACEIAQDHINKGDNITILECFRNVNACYSNPTNRLSKCFKCIAYRNTFFSKLEGHFSRRGFLNLNDEDRQSLSAIPRQFKDLEAIKLFNIDNLDLGYAALSSLISYLRDPKPDLKHYGPTIYEHMRASYSAYLSMLNHLKTGKYDRVYLFNGRYELVRGALRACQRSGVDCYIHERGNDSEHYALYINALPHDIDENHRQIMEKWEAVPATEREATGSQFFELNKRGVERNWRSFTAEQDPNLLPEGWEADKYNVVIFNSSQDEFEAIGDQYKLKFYKDQADGIQQIAESFKAHPQLRLWLRIHPNLAGINNESIRKIDAIDDSLISIIPAESKISSYRLIEDADLIITFGSTVGVEATYWGTPSILLGTSFYERLNCTYKPSSHSELIDLVLSRPEPLPKIEAIKYGLFRHTLGYPFRFYTQTGDPTNFDQYSLNDKKMRLGILDRVLLRLSKQWAWGAALASKYYLSKNNGQTV